MKKEFVVLVNKSGKKTGVAEKMKAHKQGLLHRAFSILLFNDQQQMLIQQRADSKYHFAGKWSNACCSHPRPGEKISFAATRRLKEELGITCDLKQAGHMVYKFEDSTSGMTEHEYDYIFIGKYFGEIPFNTYEIKKVRWISSEKLFNEYDRNPKKFTPWFCVIIDAMIEKKYGESLL